MDDTDRLEQAGNANMRQHEVSDQNHSWELELVQRERRLVERERALLRREREIVENSPSTVSARSAGTNANIKVIGALLNDFNGVHQPFSKWERQVRLLRGSYELDDKTAKILVASHLKGKAQAWFYSKPEILECDCDEILRQLKDMFDFRPNQFELRKQFEARTWRANETFCDYYHDKIIKANEISVSGSELIDYVIDGIPDQQLRNHARMQQFSSMSMFLQAFKQISLRLERKDYHNRYAERFGFDRRKARKENQNIVGRDLRCYNCGMVGHTSRDCKQRRREWGSCFE